MWYFKSNLKTPTSVTFLCTLSNTNYEQYKQAYDSDLIFKNLYFKSGEKSTYKELNTVSLNQWAKTVVEKMTKYLISVN